jgi:hypothetical protein
MEKLKDLIEKINLPNMVEAHKEICKFVSELNITQEQKDELNRSIEDIQLKLKELAK